MKHLLASALLILAASTPVSAAPPPNPPPVGRQVVEIYRIAPGRQRAFLAFIARCDEANRLAGLPPRQLFVHSDGADWDFMLLQPAETPKDRQAALDAAWKQLKLPEGGDFFLAIREFIAVHSDTVVSGPTTAERFLSGLR